MEKVIEIIDKIIENGYEAYFVGGCVRDFYSGYYPKDWDIVTNASPTSLVHIFKDESLNMVGKNFLVTMINDIEVATYRTEKYYTIGKPDVKKAISLEDDLSRRDFTINAIAMNREGYIIDPFNGLSDIESKIIKFVGTPKDRIEEDPCRILRACRFCALFGDGYSIEPLTRTALSEYSYLVKEHVPFERVKLELTKALSCKKPSIFFRLLEEFNLLKYILPSLHKCINIDGGTYHGETVFEHNLVSGDFLPVTKPELRLAGYLHDVGKPDAFNGENFRDHAEVGKILAISDMTRLKFSEGEINYVSSLIGNHMRFVTGMKSATLRKLIADLNKDGISWKDLLLLKISDRNANSAKSDFTRAGIKELVLKVYKSLKKERIFNVKDIKVDGNDLMTYLGMKEGPRLGIILNKLFNDVLENPKINHKFILLDRACKLLKEKETENVFIYD